MTVKIISSAYNYGYELKAPTTVLSITSTGFIGLHGITAEGAGSYTIVNMGTIYSSLHPPGKGHGSGSSSPFESPSSESNGYTGVYLQGSASITNGSANDTSATIHGESAGVVIGGAGTVANFGVISGGSYGDGVGIELDQGGTVINGAANDTSALIYGSIELKGGTNRLENFGTLKKWDFRRQPVRWNGHQRLQHRSERPSREQHILLGTGHIDKLRRGRNRGRAAVSVRGDVGRVRERRHQRVGRGSGRLSGRAGPDRRRRRDELRHDRHRPLRRLRRVGRSAWAAARQVR